MRVFMTDDEGREFGESVPPPCEKCGADTKFIANEGVGKFVRAVIQCPCGHTFKRTYMPARVEW